MARDGTGRIGKVTELEHSSGTHEKFGVQKAVRFLEMGFGPTPDVAAVRINQTTRVKTRSAENFRAPETSVWYREWVCHSCHDEALSRLAGLGR